MDLKLTVFDIAGTTVYDGDAVHHHLALALAGAGVVVERDEINAVMGIPKPIAIRTVLERHRPNHRADAHEIDEIHSHFQETMLIHYRSSSEVRPVAGAVETFRDLHSHGVKIILDTGFSRPITDAIIERLGWLEDGIIDGSVSSDEVSRGRPWPDMIYRAMTITGILDPGVVAKIGDTPSDLHEGASAGCRWVIGVTGGSHSANELAAYPHTHLIYTVADLPDLFELRRNQSHSMPLAMGERR